MTNMETLPRILLAGMNSGCGKTSITCGILKALTDRGIRIQSYKCGPDYIDPMLHSHITGQPCRNLDPFFSTEEELRELMAKDSRKAEFSVVEGVMGYYDGIGVSCEKSTHTVSAATKTPTILILNTKGMSHTMIPLISGILSYRENPVCGVILNRCSKGLYQMIKPEIERELPVKVAGYFPNDDSVHIGSRHLGLMTAAEIQNLDEVIARLGALAEECIDLDLLLRLGEKAPVLPEKSPLRTDTLSAKSSEPKTADDKTVTPAVQPAPVRIAVAWDKAFCFYYQENLDILRQEGAELVYFSPVSDRHLPENIGGIYLGGGYPETYRKELSENLSMKEDICRAAAKGMPVLAECGGFMYTCNQLVETDGSAMPMLGLIHTDVQMTPRLSMEFGYVTMEALRDTPFFDKGTQIRVHEFHYSKAAEKGNVCRMEKSTGRSWTGMYVEGNVMAGYPHLYFHNCRNVARRFVQLAAEHMENVR